MKKNSMYKLKINILLASIDLWDIVDGPEVVSSSNADSKVKREYQSHIKMVVSIIGLNLTCYQLVYITRCKGRAEA